MAKFSDVNNVMGANGGAEAIYRLKEVLKAAGWVVKSSSDGTTYNSTGDQITGSGAGAGGMNNASAWFRIQEPGGPGRREYTFQRATGGNDHQWRIKYSANAKFTGGSPGATQTPSATDEQTLLGGGTDAAPTYASMFTAAGGGYRFHAIAQSTPEGTAYGFWSFATTTPAGVTMSAIIQEPLEAGSFASADEDPVVIFCRLATLALGTVNVEGATNWRAWVKYNLSGALFQNCPCYVLTNSGGTVFIANTASPSPYNSQDVMLPCTFGTLGGTMQIKGTGKYMRWNCTSGRGYPTTTNLTTDARCYVNAMMVPWPNNTAPVL